MKCISHRTFQLIGLVLLLPLLPSLFGGTAGAQSGTLSSVTFGMQCGPNEASNCPVVGGIITLPSEPGTLGLWGSNVDWSHLSPYASGSNEWDFTTLDEYLETIVSASNVHDVIYTFGWVPCWETSDCNRGTGVARDDWDKAVSADRTPRLLPESSWIVPPAKKRQKGGQSTEFLSFGLFSKMPGEAGA